MPTSPASSYQAMTQETARSLRAIAQSNDIRSLSKLPLPQLEAVADLVAQVVPAGNVPGIILNGLARLPQRQVPADAVRRDVDLLLRGVEQVLDKAVYGTFFAGPAAAIWAYQKLMQLAGKNSANAFPDGLWQFYVEYALREDSARHANETTGFDYVLTRNRISLSPVDRLTAWVMTAIHCLHQYEALLENEWRERVYLAALRELTRETAEAERCARLHREWEAVRPYARGAEADPAATYPAYRHAYFDQFIEKTLNTFSPEIRRAWVDAVQVAKRRDWPAYHRQMSILAYLEPGPYGELRVPLPLEQAQVGLIYRQRYYLIPACAANTSQPPDGLAVRELLVNLLSDTATAPPANLAPLASLRRGAWPALRKKLGPTTLEDFNALRTAPILLNGDVRPRALPLGELRQTERGIGSHALTIFDTGESLVFDQSHIFFDGGWGAALAEILTNEALAWAVYLHQQSPARARSGGPRPRALTFRLRADEVAQFQAAPHLPAPVSAETDAINLKSIIGLRRLFKRRSDLLNLTINDLLVLFRAIHAVTYQPTPPLLTEVEVLSNHAATRAAAQAAREALESARANPAMLIPVDASLRSPRDRLYTLNFEVPLAELDLLNLHRLTLQALVAYRQATGDRTELYNKFDLHQRTYLATLAGFGAILSKAKAIAMQGQSASSGTLKLLAHMPVPVQRLLDKIPDYFDLLNDLIRGREVFSNMGAVAKTSSLRRFMTAKDDNDKKTLAWGIITDAAGVMRITLRDFRPHVAALVAVNQTTLAQRLAQDYVLTYARGLNAFIRDLRLITLASRETRTGRTNRNVG